MAQHLEALGHEVVVVDPIDVAMYGARSRRIKTDTRDVAALATANRRGVFRRAHRASAERVLARLDRRARPHYAPGRRSSRRQGPSRETGQSARLAAWPHVRADAKMARCPDRIP